MRALRRLILLLAVALVASILVRRRQRPLPTGDAPAWPPLDVIVREPEVTIGDEITVVETFAADGTVEEIDVVEIVEVITPAWVAPAEGQCPPGFPVKTTVDSGIYHVPGGRSYARTKPERCYATPEDAEADVFRRAKL